MRETLPPPFAASPLPASTVGADFLAAILDHVAHPIFVKDRDYRFVLVNQAMEEMLRIKREELIGRTDYDFFPHEEADYFRKRDEEVFVRGETVRIEEEPITDGAGARHVLATTKVPLRGADGELTHLVGIIHDITALDRARAALREANEALERRVLERTVALETAQSELMRRERLAVVGQLAGAIAHQVRNPLGSIKNAAYLLKLAVRGEPDPDVAHALAIVHDEVRRANQIITDLLDFARIRPPLVRDVGVAYVVEQSLGAAGANPRLKVEHDVDDTLFARCDAEQLQTALCNLLRNAAESMADGGTVRVEGAADGPDCVLVVRDTGPGLASETLEQLRDPMGPQERRVVVGLHLMTARALVENQGGTFLVQSSARAGTRYELRIPRARR